MGRKAGAGCILSEVTRYNGQNGPTHSFGTLRLRYVTSSVRYVVVVGEIGDVPPVGTGYRFLAPVIEWPRFSDRRLDNEYPSCWKPPPGGCRHAICVENKRGWGGRPIL